MVEVPAAALAIDEVAAGLDFVSVGTNDLLQYLAAAERTLPEVAGLYRPYSIAVWRILELIVAGCAKSGRDRQRLRRDRRGSGVCAAPGPARSPGAVGAPNSVAQIKAALCSWAATSHAERVSGEDAAPAD